MTIWKYTLDPSRQSQTIHVPWGSRILSVAEHRRDLCMWVLMVENSVMEEIEISIYGTGDPIDKLNHGNSLFIGTAILNGGANVKHIFIKER